MQIFRRMSSSLIRLVEPSTERRLKYPFLRSQKSDERIFERMLNDDVELKPSVIYKFAKADVEENDIDITHCGGLQEVQAVRKASAGKYQAFCFLLSLIFKTFDK